MTSNRQDILDSDWSSDSSSDDESDCLIVSATTRRRKHDSPAKPQKSPPRSSPETFKLTRVKTTSGKKMRHRPFSSHKTKLSVCNSSSDDDDDSLLDQRQFAKDNTENDSDSDDTAELMEIVQRANHSFQAKNKSSPGKSPSLQIGSRHLMGTTDKGHKALLNRSRCDDDSRFEDWVETTHAPHHSKGMTSPRLDSAQQEQPPSSSCDKENVEKRSSRQTSPLRLHLPEQSDSSVSSESEIEYDTVTTKAKDGVTALAGRSLQHNGTTIDAHPYDQLQAEQGAFPAATHTMDTMDAVEHKQGPFNDNRVHELDKPMDSNCPNATLHETGATSASTSATKNMHFAEVIDLSGDNRDPHDGDMILQKLPGHSRGLSPLAKSPSYNTAARSFLGNGNRTGYRSQYGHARTNTSPFESIECIPDPRRVTNEYSRLTEYSSHDIEPAARQTQQDIPKIPNPWKGKRLRRLRDATASNVALAASVVPSKKRQTYHAFQVSGTRSNVEATETRPSRDTIMRRFVQRPRLVNGNAQQLREEIRSTRHDVAGHADVRIVHPPPDVSVGRRARPKIDDNNAKVEIFDGEFERSAPPSRSSPNRGTSNTRKRRRSSVARPKKKVAKRRGGRKSWGRGKGRSRGSTPPDGVRIRRNGEENGAWGERNGAWEQSPQFQRQEDPAFERFGAEVTF
jgi:hypothetical protein